MTKVDIIQAGMDAPLSKLLSGERGVIESMLPEEMLA